MDEDDAPAHSLLWTNKDGRPRRKEVLNPDGDTVMLMDANDVEVGGNVPFGFVSNRASPARPWQVLHGYLK